MGSPFTHVDEAGRLRMVDVSKKRRSRRVATAHCLIVTSARLDSLARRNDGLEPEHAARVAGVLVAKKTDDVIPLCHSLHLSDVDVDVIERDEGLEVSSRVVATEATGVEMEALTACAFAALTLLDSLLDLDPLARIDDLAVLTKEGGKSGNWGRLVDRPKVRRRKST